MIGFGMVMFWVFTGIYAGFGAILTHDPLVQVSGMKNKVRNSAIPRRRRLSSSANTSFRIEYFSTATADPSGYGEGETYLGSDTVTTDGSGNATINTTLAVSVAEGHSVSATATVCNDGVTCSNLGDTSEFGANVTVIDVQSIGGRVFEDRFTVVVLFDHQ